ncbi:MAG: ABC transporter ATP-binding protein [candidate division Zixibacteria bacterium]|nr:ABC transporter ATP-binding protein [candidate division Zixibacteria bacterium]
MNIVYRTDAPALEAVNLTKRYDDDVLALDHVSFAIEPGQIYALLGGNGAGKTTAINLFLNFIEPTDGEARINGIVTHREPLKAKAHVAYVSENVMLYANFTAMQNLDFFARLGGQTSYTRSDYHDMLYRVGLAEEFHNKKLREFSKGMRQKCGIAIAMLKNAPAILLDEPTSGLDPKAGRDFIELLKSLKDENRAILMSTHDIFRAKEVADVVAIMNHGRLIMQKRASELAHQDLESLYMQYIGGHNNGEPSEGGTDAENAD